MRLEHGGRIRAAAQRFDIPAERWVDISTGISPFGWPVPAVPSSVWQALPEADGRLERAAADYYGCPPEALVAVPGSQYALQYLPALLPRGRVAIPLRGYAEHRLAWARAGHELIDYRDAGGLEALVADGRVDHAVLINPNNPTGELLSRSRVAALAAGIDTNGGCLVVDEAFADVYADHSVASLCPQPGLVVLRSVGKFFGLGGLRLGFMLSSTELRKVLESAMPPWLVSHPARWIGAQALTDRAWQAAQRSRLLNESRQWSQALRTILGGLHWSEATLFVSGSGDPDYLANLSEALGRRAVLIRLFEAVDGQGMVRFGLPSPDVRERVLQTTRDATEECACAVS